MGGGQYVEMEGLTFDHLGDYCGEFSEIDVNGHTPDCTREEAVSHAGSKLFWVKWLTWCGTLCSALTVIFLLYGLFLTFGIKTPISAEDAFGPVAKDRWAQQKGTVPTDKDGHPGKNPLDTEILTTSMKNTFVMILIVFTIAVAFLTYLFWRMWQITSLREYANRAKIIKSFWATWLFCWILLYLSQSKNLTRYQIPKSKFYSYLFIDFEPFRKI